MRYRPDPQMDKWKHAILERANYRCEHCGREGTDAHHIKGRNAFPGVKYDLRNGVCLCRMCHSLIHNDVEFKWKVWSELDFDARVEAMKEARCN